MDKPNCIICGGAHYAKGWCKQHYNRWWRYGDPTHVPYRPSADERFWGRVNKTDACWLWTGKTRNGYGVFQWGPRSDVKCTGAHRYGYTLAKGEIPEGLVLDHLCRVPLCVNPDHLDPVTNGENVLRGIGPSAQARYRTHCPQGHAYDDANTRYSTQGHRACRACDREKQMARVAAKGKRAVAESAQRRLRELSQANPAMTTVGLAATLGWSEGHTRRVMREVFGPTTQPIRGSCSTDGCERPRAGRGMCQMHWRHWKTAGKPELPVESCQRDGCPSDATPNGFCRGHAWRS